MSDLATIKTVAEADEFIKERNAALEAIVTKNDHEDPEWSKALTDLEAARAKRELLAKTESVQSELAAQKPTAQPVAADETAPDALDGMFLKALAGEEFAPNKAFNTEMGLADMFLKATFATGDVSGQDGFKPEDRRAIPASMTEDLSLAALRIFPVIPNATNNVEFMEETTRASGAAIVAEGTASAESSLAWTERAIRMQDIVTHIPISDRVRTFAPESIPMVETQISGLLLEKLMELVYTGDGTPTDNTSKVIGLKHNLEQSDHISGSAGARFNDNNLNHDAADSLFKSVADIKAKIARNGRVQPTHIVLTLEDLARFEAAATNDGALLYGDPSRGVPTRIKGLIAVPTAAWTDDGEAVVGNFSRYAYLAEQGPMNLMMGYNANDFASRQQTLRANIYAALVVSKWQAFGLLTNLNAA